MSGDGYTPVFETMFTGSLHGQWPDTGLWACLLAMQNKRGEIDCTPQYISSVTGLAVDQVTACIQRFMGPDEYSRSTAEGGRRLVLMDPARPWGWRVVNHLVYRERARLQAQSARQVADGRNAEKVRRYKERHRKAPEDTTGHPQTPSETLSNANANTYAEKNPQKERPSVGNARKRATSASTELPLDFALDDALRAQALKRAPDCDVDAAFESFKAHHAARGSKFRNWRAAWTTWVGNFEAFGYPRRQAVPAGMERVQW